MRNDKRKHAIYVRIWRDQRRARGVCVGCPNELEIKHANDHIYCFDCRIKRAAYAANRRRLGITIHG